MASLWSALVDICKCEKHVLVLSQSTQPVLVMMQGTTTQGLPNLHDKSIVVAKQVFAHTIDGRISGSRTHSVRRPAARGLN